MIYETGKELIKIFKRLKDKTRNITHTHIYTNTLTQCLKRSFLLWHKLLGSGNLVADLELQTKLK